MLKQIKNKISSIQIPEERAILLICIGIALIFWFLVKFSQPYKSIKEVRINIEFPEDRALLDQPPTDMKVELSGSGWDLLYEYISSSAIPLAINMVSTDVLDLNRAQLRSEIYSSLAASKLEIAEINYDEINLRLEEKLQKKIPIYLNASLEYSAEYQRQGLVGLKPDSVLVAGPISRVGPLKYWLTDSLILKNIQSSQSIDLKLANPPAELQIVPQTIKVNIPVEQFTEKSIFVPLQVMNPPPADSLKVFPDKIRITCVVGLSQYDTLTSEDFSIEVDLKSVPLNEGKNSVPIRITRQPEYVKNVSLSPKAAEFFILKKGGSPKSK
ncbi:MAG: hypothetical protein DHS20C18_16480 [Saprospiraceae bacterium]|nr:MAG: hypothetical protein DHS20C18_16480 [Saprospiraceae bacterium]